MQDKVYNIRYIFRNKKCGYSIHKVFMPLISRMPNCILSEVPCHRADPISIIINCLYVLFHRSSKYINHVTGGAHYLEISLMGHKSVLTIHDLVLLANTQNRFKRAIYKFLWFEIPLKMATKVTCISETTRRELLKNFSIPPSKVTTIYNPVDDIFHNIPKDFDSKHPRILHIGTAWNKNLKKVISALHGISCTLVIIGRLEQTMQQLLKKHKVCYENLVDISDEELFEEYKKCDIVSFPSIYEGFGMPIIEGQTVGRIVLTSNLDPMLEVAGDAAVFVDPNSIDSIQEGFSKIISDDRLRERLVEKGLENSKRFSADRIAEEYKKLYNTIL